MEMSVDDAIRKLREMKFSDDDIIEILYAR